MKRVFEAITSMIYLLFEDLKEIWWLIPFGLLFAWITCLAAELT